MCRSLVGTHNSAGLGRGVNMKDSEIWTSGDRQTKRTSQEDMAQVLRAGGGVFFFNYPPRTLEKKSSPPLPRMPLANSGTSTQEKTHPICCKACHRQWILAL